MTREERIAHILYERRILPDVWYQEVKWLLDEPKKADEKLAIAKAALPRIPADSGSHTHMGTWIDHKDCDDIHEALKKLESL